MTVYILSERIKYDTESSQSVKIYIAVVKSVYHFVGWVKKSNDMIYCTAVVRLNYTEGTYKVNF